MPNNPSGRSCMIDDQRDGDGELPQRCDLHGVRPGISAARKRVDSRMVMTAMDPTTAPARRRVSADRDGEEDVDRQLEDELSGEM